MALRLWGSAASCRVVGDGAGSGCISQTLRDTARAADPDRQKSRREHPIGTSPPGVPGVPTPSVVTESIQQLGGGGAGRTQRPCEILVGRWAVTTGAGLSEASRVDLTAGIIVHPPAHLWDCSRARRGAGANPNRRGAGQASQLEVVPPARCRPMKPMPRGRRGLPTLGPGCSRWSERTEIRQARHKEVAR
jgi:hypothetical protein